MGIDWIAYCPECNEYESLPRPRHPDSFIAHWDKYRRFKWCHYTHRTVRISDGINDADEFYAIKRTANRKLVDE